MIIKDLIEKLEEIDEFTEVTAKTFIDDESYILDIIDVWDFGNGFAEIDLQDIDSGNWLEK